MIKSPEKYAGRTLERHLQLYDWRNEYDTFDRIIKTSQFDGICNSAVVSSRVSLPNKLLLHFPTHNDILLTKIQFPISSTLIHNFHFLILSHSIRSLALQQT
jgi:hypothetical protein